MGDSFLHDIDSKDIPRLAPWLGGKFYYSKQQRGYLDSRTTNRRFFFKPLHNKKEDPPVEYTELIDWENSEDTPIYDDAVFLGYGYFHHFEEG